MKRKTNFIAHTLMIAFLLLFNHPASAASKVEPVQQNVSKCVIAPFTFDITLVQSLLEFSDHTSVQTFEIQYPSLSNTVTRVRVTLQETAVGMNITFLKLSPSGAQLAQKEFTLTSPQLANFYENGNLPPEI